MNDLATFSYLVDSHCHLNYKGLGDDLESLIQDCDARNVRFLLAINARIREFDEVLRIANQSDRIACSVGVHPHEAENEPDVSVEDLLERAKHPKVVAIGETGLDYYYDTAPRDLQKSNFRTHIKAARETGLPLIVHSRDAEDDTYNIMKEEMEEGAFKGVIHCFTASQDFAKKALSLGFYISLSGIVTFKNAKDLQDVAKTIPLDKLLVETDAPYLAPIPHRGKTCSPAYVADTAQFLADHLNLSLEDISAATTQNFFTLFDKCQKQFLGAIITP